MINLGQKIGISYIIKAIANGYVLAESQTAPDRFVVWKIDADGNGVRNGHYCDTREDAEQELCSHAFDWFDPAEQEDEEQVSDPTGYVNAAHKHIAEAAQTAAEINCREGRTFGELKTDFADKIDKFASVVKANPIRNGKVTPAEKKLFSYLYESECSNSTSNAKAQHDSIKEQLNKYGRPTEVVVDNGKEFVPLCAHGKENAPQEETAEQTVCKEIYDILNKMNAGAVSKRKLTDEIQTTVEDFVDKYNKIISEYGNLRYLKETDNGFAVRQVAMSLWNDFSLKILNDIWNINAMLL